MPSPAYFFIRINRKYIRLCSHEVQYIQAVANYVKIFTTTGYHLSVLTMKQLEKDLPFDGFCRVNRSTIVSVENIDSFDKDGVDIGNMRFSFGEGYRQQLEAKINIIGENNARFGITAEWQKGQQN